MMAWLRRLSPRAILLAGLAVFLIYSWPGFIGWDTREHILQARSGVYADGHPPAIALLFRICEVFITGPAGMLLIQSTLLLTGLYMVCKTRLSPRAAAITASAIFLFPPISGVSGLITKDVLMAGCILIAIALFLDERPGRRWLGVAFILLATLFRWNALSATFAPVSLLFQWRPGIAGIRRYAAALVVWAGVTFIAMQANELLSDRREYTWYWANGYLDISGTLHYMDPIDDAALDKLLDGLPLRYHDHLNERFGKLYSPSSYYQLMRDGDYLIEPPHNDRDCEAIMAVWKRVVLGHPSAYFRYRWENTRLLLMFERPESFSNVYVWFTVIAAPQTIPELDHDAAPSRVQDKLRVWSMWVSLSPIYFTFIYFFLCFALLPFCMRSRLEASLLLSAIGYELALFVIASTDDFRYSQWMILCGVTVAVFVTARSRLFSGRPRAVL